MRPLDPLHFVQFLADQHVAWLDVLSRQFWGYTPDRWMRDLSSLTAQWIGGAVDLEQEKAGPRPSCPTILFRIDVEAEAADAKCVGVGSVEPPVSAWPLVALDGSPVASGPRVTVDASIDGALHVGLARLRSLPLGRYVSAVADRSNTVVALILVERS